MALFFFPGDQWCCAFLEGLKWKFIKKQRKQVGILKDIAICDCNKEDKTWCRKRVKAAIAASELSEGDKYIFQEEMEVKTDKKTYLVIVGLSLRQGMKY